MKKLFFKFFPAVLVFTCLSFFACKKGFLEVEAIGSVNESLLENKEGVESLLIGTYALLDGTGGPNGEAFDIALGIHNIVFGSIASDEAHKGSELGDQPDLAAIESYNPLPTSFYFNDKWKTVYAGVQRSNDILRALAKVKNGSISEAEAQQITGEARFLRAVFHLEAAKVWRNVPYIDEKVSFENNNYFVANNASVWAKIEEDLQYAADNLDPVKREAGRANKWAANALLVKAYMFQNKFTEAKTLLADIIANGVTASGVKYALVNFSDNFNPSKQNNAESVFSVQMSVNDGAGGANGNAALVLAMPNGGPTGCCSFWQPSFDLVNSFQTDPITGLPLIDTYNNTPLKTDQGLSGNDPFTPDERTLDPRLDYTAGRRGVPYLDWGIMPGSAWIRSQASGGPYLQIKNVYYQADGGATADAGWSNFNSNNYNLIRFADVLLWAAECEVEVGTLEQSEAYVNQIRARAANPAGWVHTYLDNANPLKGFTNTPAANYKIGLYTGQFASKGKEFAREAVRFERKLELAMEGHRFFDLQRYDNGTGYMANVLNKYISYETQIPSFNYQYMQGASFKKGKNELFPIPQAQIDLSTTNGASVLKQNPNY